MLADFLGDDEFHVDRILSGPNAKGEYLIKWLGFGRCHHTSFFFVSIFFAIFGYFLDIITYRLLAYVL